MPTTTDSHTSRDTLKTTAPHDHTETHDHLSGDISDPLRAPLAGSDDNTTPETPDPSDSPLTSGLRALLQTDSSDTPEAVHGDVDGEAATPELRLQWSQALPDLEQLAAKIDKLEVDEETAQAEALKIKKTHGLKHAEVTVESGKMALVARLNPTYSFLGTEVCEVPRLLTKQCVESTFRQLVQSGVPFQKSDFTHHVTLALSRAMNLKIKPESHPGVVKLSDVDVAQIENYYQTSVQRLQQMQRAQQPLQQQQQQQQQLAPVEDTGMAAPAALVQVAQPPPAPRKTKIKHKTDYVNVGAGDEAAKYKVGKEMEATLYPKDPVKGSATGANWTWMHDLAKSKGMATKDIVRGHLLNHDLGGFGMPANLYPISQKANQEHSTGVENNVKKALSDALAMENDPLQGAPRPIKYTVKVAEASAHDPGNAAFVCDWTDKDGQKKQKRIASLLRGGQGGGHVAADNPLDGTDWHHGKKKNARRGYENGIADDIRAQERAGRVTVDDDSLDGVDIKDIKNIEYVPGAADTSRLVDLIISNNPYSNLPRWVKAGIVQEEVARQAQAMPASQAAEYKEKMAKRIKTRIDAQFQTTITSLVRDSDRDVGARIKTLVSQFLDAQAIALDGDDYDGRDEDLAEIDALKLRLAAL